MKKWTVVIEITDACQDVAFQYDKLSIQEHISDCLRFSTSGASFRIMECIEAPYGPQHPDGVFIAEVKPLQDSNSTNLYPPADKPGRAGRIETAASSRKGNSRQ